MIFDPLRLGLQQFAPMMPDEEDVSPVPPAMSAMQRMAAMAGLARQAAAARPPAAPILPQDDQGYPPLRISAAPNPIPDRRYGFNFAPPPTAAPLGVMPPVPPVAAPPPESVPFPALMNQAPIEAPPAPDPLAEERARYARVGVQFNPAAGEGPMMVRTLRGSTPGQAMLGGTPEQRTAAFTAASPPDRQAMLFEQLHGQMATEPQITAQGRGYTQYASPQTLNAHLMQAITQGALSPDELASKENIANIMADRPTAGMTTTERALVERRRMADRLAMSKDEADKAQARRIYAELAIEQTASQSGKTKEQVRNESIRQSMEPTPESIALAAVDPATKSVSTERLLTALANAPGISKETLGTVLGKHAQILTPEAISEYSKTLGPAGIPDAAMKAFKLRNIFAPQSVMYGQFGEAILQKTMRDLQVKQMIERINKLRESETATKPAP